MNGHRALIYSRVRKNLLNPAESDITRGERNQQVLQALMSKLASFNTFMRLPLIGGDLMKPLATDLSANDFARARLGEVPRGPHDPLPARRHLDRRRHHAERGQREGDPDGARQVGGAAARADRRHLSARLPDRQPRRALSAACPALRREAAGSRVAGSRFSDARS